MSNFLKNALMSCLVLAYSALQAQDLRLAMQTEQWKDVVAIYEAKAKAAPTDVESFLRLGSAFEALGQADKAKAAYMSAANADPKSKLLNVVEVRQAILAGDAMGVEKATKKAEKAARGKDEMLLRLLGESFLYGSKKNLVEAEKWLKEAYNAKPKDVETLMQLGYTYKAMTGRLGESVSFYEYASNINGTDPLPYFLIAKAYWNGRQPAKYEEFLNKTLAAEPNYAPALRDLADFQYYKRRYTEAKATYEKLIQSQGDKVNIDDEMQLSNTLFYLKDYDAVTTQVNKIINKDGSRNYLRRLLGYTYYEKGDTDKGLEIMKDYFLKVAPDKIISRDYEYYGKMLAAKKEDSLALFNLTKAIQMDSSLWQAYSEIGKVKYRNKDYAGAADAYKIRIDSLGEEVTSNDLYSYGVSSMYAKDSVRLNQAEEAFRKITVKTPKATIGWLYLGKVLAKGDPDIEADSTRIAEFGKAADSFTKYIELASAETDTKKLDGSKKDRIECLMYLAYMHISKGNTAEGCAKLNAVLAIDPANQSAIDYKAATACP